MYTHIYIFIKYDEVVYIFVNYLWQIHLLRQKVLILLVLVIILIRTRSNILDDCNIMYFLAMLSISAGVKDFSYSLCTEEH